MVLTLAFYFAFFPAPPILLLAGWHCYQPRSDPGKSADWALLRPWLPVLPAFRLANAPFGLRDDTLLPPVSYASPSNRATGTPGSTSTSGLHLAFQIGAQRWTPFSRKQTAATNDSRTTRAARSMNRRSSRWGCCIGGSRWMEPRSSGRKRLVSSQPGEPSGRAGPSAHESPEMAWGGSLGAE